jgi:hypothetical protein
MSRYMDDDRGRGLIGRGMSWRLIFLTYLVVFLICPLTLTYMGFTSFQGWSPKSNYIYDERFDFRLIPQATFDYFFKKG